MRPLTDMQARFVLEFTSGPGSIGNASESARRAGYSEKSAAEQGRQLLEKPHIIAAIDDALRVSISSNLAAKAVAVLETVLDDEEAHPKLRVEAAKTILDRAGFIAPKASEPEAPFDGKPLHEMTITELQEFIDRGEAQRAVRGRAKEDSERSKQDQEEPLPVVAAATA